MCVKVLLWTNVVLTHRLKDINIFSLYTSFPQQHLANPSLGSLNSEEEFINRVLKSKMGRYLYCNEKNKSLECSKTHRHICVLGTSTSPNFMCTIILFCRHYHYLVLLMRNLGLKKDNECVWDHRTAGEHSLQMPLRSLCCS